MLLCIYDKIKTYLTLITEVSFAAIKVPVKLKNVKIQHLLKKKGLKVLDYVGTFSAQMYKGKG